MDRVIAKVETTKKKLQAIEDRLQSIYDNLAGRSPSFPHSIAYLLLMYLLHHQIVPNVFFMASSVANKVPTLRPKPRLSAETKQKNIKSSSTSSSNPHTDSLMMTLRCPMPLQMQELAETDQSDDDSSTSSNIQEAIEADQSSSDFNSTNHFSSDESEAESITSSYSKNEHTQVADITSILMATQGETSQQRTEDSDLR
ncbi:OLC1v1008552C1 [Oldenlandia corymbosa var. corymbosa]|uniref:OLC1v1008552C1 n=1 Tax=Oldenlandia corymbosa var. corymbosa TaxID=529605 RepID=A0AAV1DQ76_OLDCO|nr:OLC1v1008552C1 [Oldenlandia corymbosa var. corymbosa]